MGGFQTPTTPPRVSFGIELEFLVAYVLEGEADPDQGIADELQPLVVVPFEENHSLGPPGFGMNSYESEEITHMSSKPWVFDQIRNALTKAGLPVYNAKENLEPTTVQARHSKNVMSAFHLVEDCSLAEFKMDGYRFQKVEMNSPAMYDMPICFDLIRLAVSVITTTFRCRVNPTCGFHVHVGAGPTERIDARTLRNFAALLWAADPLISRLHAPWRSITRYSQSGRVNEVTGLGRNEGPADTLLKELTTDRFGVGGRPIGGAWLKTPRDALPKSKALSRVEMKMVKYFGRDRLLGESVDPEFDVEAMQREIDVDTDDDLVVLRGEPWTHRATHVSPTTELKSAMVLEPDDSRMPKIDYTPPVPRPPTWGDYRNNSTLEAFAPPRPRPPPIRRRYARIPGTMRQDRRDEPGFLAPHLARHGHGTLQDPDPRVPPRRSDVMSGVRDLLGADMTSAQIGEMMRNKRVAKHINYKFDGYSLPSMKMFPVLGGVRGEDDDDGGGGGGCSSAANSKNNTVEFREAAGTLDGQWIATWAKICCRLLEWSRDAAPAEYMCVIRLLAWAQEEDGAEYDVVDFLIDIGLIVEARACEERVNGGDEVWWECLNVLPPEDAGRFWETEGEGAGFDDDVFGWLERGDRTRGEVHEGESAGWRPGKAGMAMNF
ncbi:uncharacterized protein CTRU02_208636 [Colletotrichum truncatum]|uniref:Uncharacterized protein n=1 Tax=Colletotrichum truncatum TaxID=5467 RepID=A0ACC3YWU5_COLTU|nr:uncharacterized protein CTRU02_15035 [Colletotrichum truncatum]KAF6781530.1 hypothetical protein CTRU02_15035 [Colletotrichum truncatum]